MLVIRRFKSFKNNSLQTTTKLIYRHDKTTIHQSKHRSFSQTKTPPDIRTPGTRFAHHFVRTLLFSTSIPWASIHRIVNGVAELRRFPGKVKRVKILELKNHLRGLGCFLANFKIFGSRNFIQIQVQKRNWDLMQNMVLE